MWIDIAMTSIMTYPGLFTDVTWPETVKWSATIINPLPPFETWLGRINGIMPNGTFWKYSGAAVAYAGTAFDEVVKWNDVGWICAKGKRPKKKWTPELKAVKMFVSDMIAYDNIPPPPAYHWKNGYPNNVTTIGLRKYPSAPLTSEGWCFYLPPMYWKRQDEFTGVEK